MRLMTIILAILILYLSGIPCNDVQIADNENTIVYSQIQNNHDHNGNAPNSDGCSPFCICHCSYTHIVIPNHPLGIPVAIHQTQEKSNYYQDFYPNGIVYTIWKPPQSA